MTKLQQNALHYFKNHPEHIILQTDKNLGPCVMNRDDRISQCMKQHLSNEKCYRRISEDTARTCIDESMEEFIKFVERPGFEIGKKDLQYLKEAAETWTGMSTFYCLPKVHKKKTPILLRPAVATIGAPLCALGKWTAKIMKPITKQISTCIRDSDEFMQKLKGLGQVGHNEYFFTSDAVAMHPNI